MKRACGVLLPIFSLPSKYGIGCFSKEAYEFVDFLQKAGQSYWQILPLGPTSYGDSPYQAFSTFAGNPYFIDLDKLVEAGYLKKSDLKLDWGESDCANGSDYVNYAVQYKNRFKVLKKAFKNSNISQDSEYVCFCKKNDKWLDNYATYMAIKDAHKGVSYLKWESDIRLRKKEALAYWKEKCEKEIEFYKFIQYLFYSQWKELKKYANSKGIKIVGDIPIYVSLDSADTWANPQLFQLDETGYPTAVAGCPPDYFSADGQLWGNPLYDWEYHKKTNYKWWIERFRASFNLYDIVRVDHFRGFESFYSIPYGEPTARNGKWVKGPGYDLFRVVKEKLKDKEVIAEDLGFITPAVHKLIKRCGYPGMKIMIYGFDSQVISEHAPFEYLNNCVVYTGTHDNDTINAWFASLPKEEKDYAREYLNFKGNKDVSWHYIRCAMESSADTAIFPMQDYLGLGAEAKINTPSTIGNNWKWRMIPGVLTDELAQRMLKLAKVYHRVDLSATKTKTKYE